MVIGDGYARIDDLASRFGVSVMTIHRDLDALQRQGWLRKVRGGATAKPSALFHGDVRHRMSSMAREKAAVAAAAVELVPAGAALVLDDSTTSFQVARLLAERPPRDLTVITNFRPTVNLLAGHPGIDLVVLGGAYYPAYDAFLGIRTLEAIRPLRADLLFASTTAITDLACYHTSTETIQVKRALMEASERRILLIDHDKLARRALHEFCPLSAFDEIFVDAGVGPADLERLRSSGVPVRLAQVEEPGDVWDRTPTGHES